ncbi:MAG: hypothetical protein NVSMB17_17290 [Candidatus Dormibacteria bacterium]
MNPESPAAALDRLEGEAATGCLLVDDLRVYLVAGTPVHAEGPAATGNVALTEALTRRSATVSFEAGPAFSGGWTIDPDAGASPLVLPAEWPEEPEVPPEDRVQLAFRTADASALRAVVVLGGIVLLGIVFYLAVNSRG